jgi:hypothetical protein
MIIYFALSLHGEGVASSDTPGRIKHGYFDVDNGDIDCDDKTDNNSITNKFYEA